MKNFLISYFLFFSVSIFSQNTIGVLLNSEDSFDGYTLFTIYKETYLINNCGQIINQWTSDYTSGKSVYLLENGNLLRASVGPNPANIAIPGIGGRIELFDWEGNKIWEYVYSDLEANQHHDIYPMPNGSILVLAASIISETEAIEMGRNPSNLPDAKLYNEHIIEIEPVGTDDANIIWRWDFKDHFIQDFDSTKDNFGIVRENPQLMDINFLGDSEGSANWMHINSIHYNQSLDQIILSSKLLNEIYIIDHSTTTTEAAGNTGGIYQKGGDLLYRWGNPAAYNLGSIFDKKLFGQHNPHWIAEGLIDAGKIIIYNNGINRETPFSEINIIEPETNSPGIYIRGNNTAFGPVNPSYTYGSITNTDFYSPILSSAQRLPNGNILICEGTKGHFFEIDSNENVVWEYINPVSANGILSQGDRPISNAVFRAKKYPIDYPAFIAKDVTPGNPIELNPNLSNCTLDIEENYVSKASIFPNPFLDSFTIKSNQKISKIELFNYLGKRLIVTNEEKITNLNNLNSGVYIVKIYFKNRVFYKKIIKK